MRRLACCGSCFTQRGTGRDLAGCNFYSDAVLCVKGWEKCNFAIAGKQDKKSVSQGGFPQQNRKVKMRGKDNDFTELSVEMISTAGLDMQANKARERNTQNHTNKTQKSLQISVKDVERFLPSQRSFPNTDAEVGRCVLHFFSPFGPVSPLFQKAVWGLSVSVPVRFHLLQVSLHQTAPGARVRDALCACRVVKSHVVGRVTDIAPRAHQREGENRLLPGCATGRSGGCGVAGRRTWGDRKAPKRGRSFSVCWEVLY